MTGTRRAPATASPPAVDRVVVATAVVEVRQVVMEAVGANSHHLSTEEVTTTIRRAMAPLPHQATVSRANMARMKVIEFEDMNNKCASNSWWPNMQCMNKPCSPSFLCDYASPVAGRQDG